MFEVYFLQTAHLKRVTGTRNQYGQPTYGEPVAFSCRQQPTSRRFITPDGSEVVASGQLFTLESITVADLIYLPGVDPSERPDECRHPLAIEAHYQLLDGTLSHYTVTV